MEREQLQTLFKLAHDEADAIYCDLLNARDGRDFAEYQRLKEEGKDLKTCPNCGAASTQFDIDQFTLIHPPSEKTGGAE